jgi:hypothetical protein
MKKFGKSRNCRHNRFSSMSRESTIKRKNTQQER